MRDDDRPMTAVAQNGAVPDAIIAGSYIRRGAEDFGSHHPYQCVKISSCSDGGVFWSK